MVRENLKILKRRKLKKRKKFPIPKRKENEFCRWPSGDRDTIHQFLFERRMESAPSGRASMIFLK